MASSSTRTILWIGGRALAACDDSRRQRRHDYEVHDERQARDEDRQQRTEQGQPRHGKRPSGHRRLRRHAAKEVYAADGYGNKRVIVFDSETGKFKRMWGAFGNPPPPTFAANAPGRKRRRRPTGRRSSACRTRSRCRATASSTSPIDQQPHPVVHARREVHQAGARHERRQRRRAGAGRLRVFTRSQAAVSVRRRLRTDAGRHLRSRKLTQIGAIGNRGPKPGDFDIVHHMAADSKGNLYTAEIVKNRRAQRFVLTSK